MNDALSNIKESLYKINKHLENIIKGEEENLISFIETLKLQAITLNNISNGRQFEIIPPKEDER
jgi:hypothetical protein